VISRRSFFLKAAFATAAVLNFRAGRVFASPLPERSLNLYNIHTGESLDIAYFSDGRYDPAAIEKINYLLRCHYTNEVKPMDLGVLDLLSGIRDVLGRNKQLRIISGYRSPQYNNYLRGLGRHVAKESLHLKGLAIDFAVDGIGTSRVAGIAKSFISGGVGRYPEFVHVDVGRVRYW